MRCTARVALAVCAVVLGAACSGPTPVEPAPSPSSAGSSVHTSEQRALLLDIPRGDPPASGWARGATIWPPGGSRVRLDLLDFERVTTVVAYRGGYLAAVRHGRRPGRAVVFDAQGHRSRRLDGCLQSVVRSPDRSLVAWMTKDCGGTGVRTLHVGPGRDRKVPDQTLVMPALGSSPASPNGYPAYATAVGPWGVVVDLTDGIRGYSKGVYVVHPDTGEVRLLPRTVEVVSVSAQGVAYREGAKPSLVDVATLEDLGRSRRIEAWSPDGTQGLEQVRTGRRVEVFDTSSGETLRTFTLPAALAVGSGQWEDDSDLLFRLYRYDTVGGHSYSTIVRVTASGDVERVTGVTQGEAYVL